MSVPTTLKGPVTTTTVAVGPSPYPLSAPSLSHHVMLWVTGYTNQPAVVDTVDNESLPPLSPQEGPVGVIPAPGVTH